MRTRQRIPMLEKQLFCSRTLHTRLVTQNMNFRQAVQSAPNRQILQLILAWLTKYGPFWEDDRESNAEDYFEQNGQDVTDLGLGEAARRRLSGQCASSFSFRQGGFDYTPIEIRQGLPENIINTVLVRNIWDMAALRQNAQNAVPAPVNWLQMLEQAQGRFDKLTIYPDSITPLRGEPFSQYVVERVFELLGVLQEFMECLHVNGNYSERNNELIATHFSGTKAWFSDESDTNRRDYSKELTFVDPENGGNVFCPWHGKIKTPQYRIHFEWPVGSKSVLRIFYIGKKITKH